MKISFHGGAQDVTGACYLLETGSLKLLIDCGLFQGGKECEDINFEKFQFDPAGINYLLVTHAHIDHVGRIPKLVREGFRGKILSTKPTRDLARLLLEDSLSLAIRQNDQLFAMEDLERTFTLWSTVDYGFETALGEAKIKLHNSGHILGSALIEIWAEGKHLLFTGDLGNTPSVLLPPPEKFKNLDFLVIESVYGTRTHENPLERNLQLERAVEDAASRKGVLVVPSFAAERTQDILHLLNGMLLFKRIPEMPVFVDSPLAIKITAVFEQYAGYFNKDIQELLLRHPNLFKFKKLKFTQTTDESKSINEIPPPKVIIAGSGMMNGGRILHHALRYLPDPASILLLIGYQGRGSVGRRLLEGERMVKLFGEEVLVKAEVRSIQGFSAHADAEQLYDFVDASRDMLKKVFVVQGEETEALGFAQKIKDYMGLEAKAPILYQKFEI
ncbi:MAG: MBL fold metallo-hydrolase [bacterium]|nr:MBL fold metallo-hydrolase [bacterium]